MGTITMASEEYDAMVAERDRLRAENERLRKSCAGVIARSVHETLAATNSALDGYLAAGIAATDAELDTLRQQLAERDATIERLEAGIPRIQEQSHQMRQQRDKLAGLLRDAAQIIDTLKGDPVAAGEMLGDIDAALAEVNK